MQHIYFSEQCELFLASMYSYGYELRPPLGLAFSVVGGSCLLAMAIKCGRPAVYKISIKQRQKARRIVPGTYTFCNKINDTSLP